MTLCDGKYKFLVDEHGVLRCDRNGEPWRDFVGDKAIRALFDHAEELEGLVESLREERLKQRLDAGF